MKAIINSDRNFKRFIQERNEALRSLDKEKILKYCKKYGVRMPTNEIAFWGGIHKARCNAENVFTEEEKELSRKWLREHGMSEHIG